MFQNSFEIITNIFSNNNNNNNNNNNQSEQIIMDEIFTDDNIIINKNIQCNHDWIEYDEKLLNEIAEHDIKARENQLTRILIKKLTNFLDKLDISTMELVFSRKSNVDISVKGKCVVCDKIVQVVYINDKTHAIIY
jgi:hypothetical protein